MSVSQISSLSSGTTVSVVSTSSIQGTTFTVDSLPTIVLLPSQTSVPAPPRSCSPYVQTPPQAFPACAIVAYEKGAGILQSCCNGAPRVLYNDRCNLYCEARNQSQLTLNNCISSAFSSLNTTNSTISGYISCNRAGVSFSSILPANTEDPATRTTPTSGAAGQTSTGAAAAGPVPAFDRQVSLSIGAWATMAILALSGFATILV